MVKNQSRQFPFFFSPLRLGKTKGNHKNGNIPVITGCNIQKIEMEDKGNYTKN